MLILRFPEKSSQARALKTLTIKYQTIMLQPGDKAPEFSLRASDKSLVKLSEQRGKNVVLLFFPFAFTGVCTKELCYMRDSLAQYNDLDAQILAVSVDSPFTLAQWKEEQGFNFPLLSDFNKSASKKYDVLYKEFAFGLKGVAKRSAFVIDKKGIVRYAEVLENAGDLPNFEAVSATLKSL
jgi:peroxiredoxin